MKLLVINPGSTSTKIAVYENEVPRLVRSIRHTVDELSSFSHIIDQFEFRKNLVQKELEANNIPFEFDAIVGRGGLLNVAFDVVGGRFSDVRLTGPARRVYSGVFRPENF